MHNKELIEESTQELRGHIQECQEIMRDCTLAAVTRALAKLQMENAEHMIAELEKRK